MRKAIETQRRGGAEVPEQNHRLLLPIDNGPAKWLSFHALARYRERTHSETTPEPTVLSKIANRLGGAHEMELLEKFKVIEMIDHGRHARYFQHKDLIFVIVDESVVTIHLGSAPRWRVKRS